MFQAKLLDEFSQRFSELLNSSPARDMEKNARALFASALSRMDLVTREEFEAQRDAVQALREQVAALERRIADSEAKRT